MRRIRLSLSRGTLSHHLPLRAMCFCLAVIVSIAMEAFASASGAAADLVAGWLEHARLSPGGVVLDAKLDSGARTSSLHATEVRQFEREGKKWVAFDVVGDGGRRVHFERPLVRMARIRSAPGVGEARPTVMLGICIGPVYRVTEVNLVDRSGLSKPLLIGRRFLEGRLRIDPSRRYTLVPVCSRDDVP